MRLVLHGAHVYPVRLLVQGFQQDFPSLPDRVKWAYDAGVIRAITPEGFTLCNRARVYVQLSLEKSVIYYDPQSWMNGGWEEFTDDFKVGNRVPFSYAPDSIGEFEKTALTELVRIITVRQLTLTPHESRELELAQSLLADLTAPGEGHGKGS